MTDHALAQPSHCANCGAAVAGHYCAACGQETRLHMPSAAEFAHEFIGHYVALEGKLWKTLVLLLCRPGRLTAEYLAGRRARYVQPLRLYLTFSVLFFALFQHAGFNVVNFDAPDNAGPGQHAARAPAVVTLAPGPAALAKPADESTLGRFVAYLNPHWEAKGDAFDALSPEAKGKLAAKSFFSYGPYALFLLMPVFALYLKLLYLGSGRRYGEHLLFALHSNAFAYVTFALVVLAPFGIVKFALVLWLLAYLPLAMRRVYGGAIWATLLRWLVLVLLHVLSIACAILAAFALAIVL